MRRSTRRVVARVRVGGGESVISRHEEYVLEAGALDVEDPRECATQVVRSQIRYANGGAASCTICASPF
jgi:hypothetical protein